MILSCYYFVITGYLISFIFSIIIIIIIIIVTVISLLGVYFEDIVPFLSNIIFIMEEIHRFPVNLFVEYEKMLARESVAFAFLLNTDGDLRHGVTIWHDIGLHDVITRQTRARRFVKLRADASFIPFGIKCRALEGLHCFQYRSVER